ncbi:MAG: iron chelate uptake ABC transporter family permease subunit, partial [Pseudomonadota bacterium]|nr:iron chelate uptake ABC transporter family permease subunit [Pseudomonadota bacterium]
MSLLTAKSAGLRRLRGNGVLLLAGVLVLAISIVAAIGAGAVPIPGSTVFKVLVNGVVPGYFDVDWSKGREAIVWEIRFPRALLAGFVGAGLAVVGAALQSVTRNPLADPHLLGISSGAAAGAILALLHTGLFLGLMTVPLMAFAGAL